MSHLVLVENKEDLDASVHELLSTAKGKEAALSLTGDAAQTFLDILQNVCCTFWIQQPPKSLLLSPHFVDH